MAALPSYVKIILDNYGEDFDPSVLRTEMERGPAKQRLLNTNVTMEVSARLQFGSKADAAAFDSWYFDTIQRIGYFTFRHPRLKTTITGRFKGGKLGPLQPVMAGFDMTQRDVTLEYQR